MKTSPRLLAMVTLGMCLILSASAEAPKNPDFSGKWKLNEIGSDPGEGRFFLAEEIVVSQKGNELTIDRVREGRDGQMRTTSETVKLDGSENLSEGDNRKTTSVAAWSEDGKTLTIRYEIEFSRQGQSGTMQRTEEWSLDGKTLNIISKSNSSRGERTMTLAYEKQ